MDGVGIRLIPEAAISRGCLVVVPILGSRSGMQLLVHFIRTKFNGLIFNMEYAI